MVILSYSIRLKEICLCKFVGRHFFYDWLILSFIFKYLSRQNDLTNLDIRNTCLCLQHYGTSLAVPPAQIPIHFLPLTSIICVRLLFSFYLYIYI